MIFPQAKSSKKSHHFLVFFAKIPFPRPPCLSALPYGKITFNLYLQKWWKPHDLEKPRNTMWAWVRLKTRGPRTAKKMRSKSPLKTFLLQSKSSYLRRQALPYGRAERQGQYELQEKVDQDYLYKTFMFEWKWAYLRLRDLPYGRAQRQGVREVQKKFNANCLKQNQARSCLYIITFRLFWKDRFYTQNSQSSG